MNSRNAYRNAQALAGCRAFVRVVPLVLGQMPEHRESEDCPHPGGSRV